MNFPSQLVEDAVQAFASLPGIGKKTALRLVLHLLQKEESYTENISSSLLKLRTEIKFASNVITDLIMTFATYAMTHTEKRIYYVL